MTLWRTASGEGHERDPGEAKATVRPEYLGDDGAELIQSYAEHPLVRDLGVFAIPAASGSSPR